MNSSLKKHFDFLSKIVAFHESNFLQTANMIVIQVGFLDMPRLEFLMNYCKNERLIISIKSGQNESYLSITIN